MDKELEGAPPSPIQQTSTDRDKPPSPLPEDSYAPAQPEYDTYQESESNYQDSAYPIAVTQQYQDPGDSTEGRRKVKDDRNLLELILLSIVTCGIYGYYNVYTMAQDMNTICADDDETTGGIGIYILLSIVTCGIYSLYWEYKLANRIASNAPRYGITVQESGTDILLWRVLGSLLCVIGSYYGYYLLLQNINKLAKAYNEAYGLE